MNRGLVDLKELRKNMAKADFCGKSAYCFINGNKIIKLYVRPTDGGFYNCIDPTKVCDLSMFSADTIVFPEEYIYENGEIVGEISKYIRSKAINESFNNTAIIESIINGYDKVVKDLYLYNNINMVDLCFVNVLYSNKNGFHLIDTTEWYFQDNSLKKNMYYFNMSLIDAIVIYLDMPVIYSKFYNKIDNTFLNNVEKYGSAGDRLKESIYAIMSNKYNFLRLLYAYMDTYRIHYGEDAKTLKDVNEFTKVLKKG